MGLIDGVKKFWKILKIVVGVIVLGLIVFIAIKMFGGKVENPDVAKERVYAEKNDGSNNTLQQPEITNLILNGKDWIELSGTYESSDDKDFFKVAVDPEVFANDSVYKIKLVVIHDNEVMGKLYMVDLPLQAISYQADGKSVVHAGLGLGQGLSVKEGTTTIVFKSYGKESKDKTIPTKYGNGKSYKLKFL